MDVRERLFKEAAEKAIKFLDPALFKHCLDVFYANTAEISMEARLVIDPNLPPIEYKVRYVAKKP